ncbi:hypothetical protein GEO60473_07370 [Geobacter sp. 60473]|nr:hypothetical protein GEO60473_07370 [Geobacter sp. 60473]
MRKIRVLVVDDSAYSRRAITKMLESMLEVDVIGYAADGEEGIRKIIDLKPDLVTLDLEMPRMDGFTLLRIVMEYSPTAVIVISSRSELLSRQAAGPPAPHRICPQLHGPRAPLHVPPDDWRWWPSALPREGRRPFSGSSAPCRGRFPRRSWCPNTCRRGSRGHLRNA